MGSSTQTVSEIDCLQLYTPPPSPCISEDKVIDEYTELPLNVSPNVSGTMDTQPMVIKWPTSTPPNTPVKQLFTNQTDTELVHIDKVWSLKSRSSTTKELRTELVDSPDKGVPNTPEKPRFNKQMDTELLPIDTVLLHEARDTTANELCTGSVDKFDETPPTPIVHTDFVVKEKIISTEQCSNGSSIENSTVVDGKTDEFQQIAWTDRLKALQVSLIIYLSFYVYFGPGSNYLDPVST